MELLLDKMSIKPPAHRKMRNKSFISYHDYKK